MCGITGFIHPGSSGEALTSRLATMLKPIYHRGPDDGGTWCDERYGLGLGHRRLSILDLSTAGHQPMASRCDRFVIVFNGEIYNHLELRKQLDQSAALPAGGWRGHSDTETLLQCFVHWGLEKTLQATVGMFALALWDKRDRSLTLARDRIGEKPLHYGWQNDAFLFGSELKSLRAHPSFHGRINRDAASTFLRMNFIPAPSTIYEAVHKLAPGTFLTLTQSDIASKALPAPIAYWSLGDAARTGLERGFSGNFNDAVDELEMLVRRAVQLQSVADVPVGAFLSGGIDSSIVVAMMKSATTSKVTTFSIGMPDAAMDESRHAAAVARHLGTNHVEHFIEAREALDLIPRLSEIWDEPFADSSQIPTYLVSKMAKREVTVALSGDGGDEFFLGYSQYAFYQKVWRTRQLRHLPWNVAFAALSPLDGAHRAGVRLRQAKSVVAAWHQTDTQQLSRYWMDRYRQGEVPLMHQGGAPLLDFPPMPDAATTAGLWDAGTYLPDDILVKVDRASMANSLETRAPLLDHRIIEFAYSLPLSFKLEGRVGKKVLREALYRHVPREIVDRPKMGFSIPLAAWLRKELRPWAEEILARIPSDSGIFNKRAVDSLWRDHVAGTRDNTEQLWGILSLQAFDK